MYEPRPSQVFPAYISRPCRGPGFAQQALRIRRAELRERWGGGWQRDGKCYVLVSLPTYEIVKIVTGQSTQGPFDSSSRLLWEASYSPPLSDGENRS